MQMLVLFDHSEFDENGFQTNGLFFGDLITQWEMEFHKNRAPLYANHLFLNHRGMTLLQNCFPDDPDFSFGLDLIDGEPDIEANEKMDVTEKRLIYALGSKIKEIEDEPVYIFRDDSLSDGQALLKYIPEGGEGEDAYVQIDTDGVEEYAGLVEKAS